MAQHRRPNVRGVDLLQMEYPSQAFESTGATGEEMSSRPQSRFSKGFLSHATSVPEFVILDDDATCEKTDVNSDRRANFAADPPVDRGPRREADRQGASDCRNPR